MFWSSQRKIHRLIDADRVHQAIDAAERRTSGEIRVSVAPWFWGSVERAAQNAFVRLGMTRTRERNGVLFFVVPGRRTFMVLGDSGIHEHVGQHFWEELALLMSQHFRRREFTDGVLAGIARVAEELAQHFPYDPERDHNELPNDIEFMGRAAPLPAKPGRTDSE